MRHAWLLLPLLLLFPTSAFAADVDLAGPTQAYEGQTLTWSLRTDTPRTVLVEQHHRGRWQPVRTVALSPGSTTPVSWRVFDDTHASADDGETMLVRVREGAVVLAQRSLRVLDDDERLRPELIALVWSSHARALLEAPGVGRISVRVCDARGRLLAHGQRTAPRVGVLRVLLVRTRAGSRWSGRLARVETRWISSERSGVERVLVRLR